MRVSEIMSKTVELAEPEECVQVVARRMVDRDLGYLPVGSGDELVGSLTDRDIVARMVAEGRQNCRVEEIMTPDVKYCYEEEEAEQVVGNMANNGVRRMPVVNREKRLVGIVSLSDAALAGKEKVAGLNLGKLASEQPTQ